MANVFHVSYIKYLSLSKHALASGDWFILWDMGDDQILFYSIKTVTTYTT